MNAIIQQNNSKLDLHADYKTLYEDLKAEHIETVKAIKQAKTEAITEFAGRVKIIDFSGVVGEHYMNGEMYGYFDSGAFGSIIDKLVKEMVGE